MNTKEAKKTLQEIAGKEGVGIEQIRQEIEAAITAARSDPDPTAQALWASIPHKGEYPTPEEVIVHILGQLD